MSVAVEMEADAFPVIGGIDNLTAVLLHLTFFSNILSFSSLLLIPTPLSAVCNVLAVVDVPRKKEATAEEDDAAAAIVAVAAAAFMALLLNEYLIRLMLD
mmetsp:Transcript_12466/g.18701  ORF Transcript_12466/g.18701 Transcript_12466/m.18701 type:complete len:100 (+) Transcript_12466:526-825(+)